MILAGDVGGTNARLALFERDGARLRMRWRADYPSRDSDWTELLARARQEAGVARVDAAALAVAGPVVDGAAELTNLGWRVSEHELAARLGLPRARLLNDLEAAGHGVLTLAPEALVTLHEGQRGARGNRALCSPGTGLGVAGILARGDEVHVQASEGGHASFAPDDEEGRALCAWLAARHGHVSWERLLSGPGLVTLYAFERERSRHPESPGLARARTDEDPAAITRAALEERHPDAVSTLERFARLLGSVCGDLALTFLATGGVYVGGGIPPRIRAFLEQPGFRAAFRAKGRMTELLARVPVRLVLEPDCALLGAAHVGARSAGTSAEAEADG